MRVPALLCRCLVAGLLVVAVTPPATAVLIDRIGGGNTTAPSDDPGFNNVGAIWIGGGVYLGNGWVLTAKHMSGDGDVFTIGGVSHSMVNGTYQQLTNNGFLGASTLTDLAMFQIQGPLPNLPTISIASTAPGNGDMVTMIGRGVDQQSDPTYWSVNTVPNPWVWTETMPGSANAAGFKTTGTQTMRWGTNAIDATGWFNDGWDVRGMRTQFNSGVSTNEGQVVYGDSGGAVFAKQSGQWNLAGIIIANDPFNNQPGGSTTAVYGNHSYFADLSFYRSQIVTIAVPEPAGLTQLFAAGLAGGVGLWWRRRSRL